ncbi:MAG: type II toxin-antitoxin system YafQ family toxin [Methylohalobius crimeensis]
MPSKKSAKDKRARIPRASDYTRAFLKDWQRLSRAGRFDMHRLKQVMLLLIANEGPLPREYRDHPLSGTWQDFRECHIGGDFLLIYRIQSFGGSEQIVFTRAGTHADLFE